MFPLCSDCSCTGRVLCVYGGPSALACLRTCLPLRPVVLAWPCPALSLPCPALSLPTTVPLSPAGCPRGRSSPSPSQTSLTPKAPRRSFPSTSPSFPIPHHRAHLLRNPPALSTPPLLPARCLSTSTASILPSLLFPPLLFFSLFSLLSPIHRLRLLDT